MMSTPQYNPPKTAVPSIACIGRKNSGKTTLVTALISQLDAYGLRVGSVKHHAHPGFDFDVPGKDSWRHAQAGSRHSVIVGVDKVGSVREVEVAPELPEVLEFMTDVDIVVVEGFRKTGLPSIEIIRHESERDMAFLAECLERADAGEQPFESHIVAVASNDAEALALAQASGLSAFDLDNSSSIASFILEYLGFKDI